MHQLVVTLDCPDRPGIVHAISGGIVAARGNITELQQFSSPDTGHFFTRIEVQGADPAELETEIAAVASDLGARFRVDDATRPTRTLILASKAGHVVNDLLFRWRGGDLPIDVVGIMANHDVLAPMAEFYGVPFTHRVVTAESKADFEAEVRRAVGEQDVELVVLARYMQILSPELCAFLAGRAVNIHHSFLPGFKGANPYRQAHTRGVKLIGATAHFVTSDLDEGPIIEQNVVRVDHTMDVAKLVRKGQAQESQTLAEAVRLLAEHRVLADGDRTVIFR
ncbi:formyltetrahydrofolate deformylase [Tessaracoccus lapidicaptus]|uniref:Formyltetrahydrofolate deformylase n=1 Tax=Tessaracoccus lapidicaptus TaxID=1427523 RepID=A0A1C0AQ35_9ACTN|nr:MULTISPECIES: formyltetrahydrofolate deformylase [Tessaracoccus]AQX15187.1 formyltetrahydrofolate deformylase [Tessaracoccus sp. T2.5-30]OCL36501.1 formyltetrahydrofolate deformylase [Tessaracoccus lapidicaptus]VEP39415.1 Formyltetrahydrofolate deformylase [Tessaracoccus lapidicaptus]